jgi:hypothetical protein
METTNGENQIAIYQSDNSVQLEVLMENETVWLTQLQMVTLFDRDKSVISRHIKNIFDEGELSKNSVVANFATTASDGKTYEVEHYNLDVIISVGYRVKSKRGTQFRQWANKILKDYLLKGYAINQHMLIKMSELTDKVGEHDQYIKILYDYLKSFDDEQKRLQEWKNRKPIGFVV